MSRDEMIRVRVTASEIERWQDDAEEQGMTLSEYIRHAVSEQRARTCPRCKGTGRIASKS